MSSILMNVRRCTFALALASAATGGCAIAPRESEDVGAADQALEAPVWGDHVAKAAEYVSAINPGNQVNNTYASPASLYYDESNVLHAATQCGSFTTNLLINTFPGVITTSVMQGLTGSTSPGAAQWHDGIDPSVAHSPSGGISLLPMDSAAASPTGRTMAFLAVGDILAAKYTVGSASGHVMTAAEITPPAGADLAVTLSGTRVIPGVATVNRWRVKVFDSTSSIHSTSDSRYQTDPSEPDGNDRGIGSGHIFLYEDATPGAPTVGQLVGWTWSTASSYTFQFTDPSGVGGGSTTYRPMVIGRMSGAGL
jgi:hypothetical protein